ncbi:MAG: hypothetical protein HND53_04045 [Proteobacteria bacterium]|nr:hypothetical protein [Pseudomonadota bacterium]NOG59647.1 hypothetical protein [Pseudomonadota bacterium]
MKLITILLSITLFPFSVFADDLDNQINKACLRHAVSLVAKLKNEVVGELNQDKSNQALKIATDSCQAYFKKEFTHNPEAVATVNIDKKSDNDEGSAKDWLTEKILNSEVKRKKGNERLRNLKH